MTLKQVVEISKSLERLRMQIRRTGWRISSYDIEAVYRIHEPILRMTLKPCNSKNKTPRKWWTSRSMGEKEFDADKTRNRLTSSGESTSSNRCSIILIYCTAPRTVTGRGRHWSKKVTWRSKYVWNPLARLPPIPGTSSQLKLRINATVARKNSKHRLFEPPTRPSSNSRPSRRKKGWIEEIFPNLSNKQQLNPTNKWLLGQESVLVLTDHVDSLIRLTEVAEEVDSHWLLWPWLQLFLVKLADRLFKVGRVVHPHYTESLLTAAGWWCTCGWLGLIRCRRLADNRKLTFQHKFLSRGNLLRNEGGLRSKILFLQGRRSTQFICILMQLFLLLLSCSVAWWFCVCIGLKFESTFWHHNSAWLPGCFRSHFRCTLSLLKV